MARRNVFNGVSAWEREEKANQQRDYAAQLQEQVLQKQAKQEQEKARRQQEQREELEMLERERAAATRQPQQEEKPPEPLLLAPSPQPSVSITHTLAVKSLHQGAHAPSPQKSVNNGPDFTSTGVNPGPDPVQHYPVAVPTTNLASESCTPFFNSTASNFESLLREPGIGARSIVFYDDLAALQRLAAELDSAAKQRRAQGTYVKPDFLHQHETAEVSPTSISSATLQSPVKTCEIKVNQEYNQLGNTHTTLHPRRQLNLDRLPSESVLLPLSTLPSTKSKSIPRAGKPLIKPSHGFIAATEANDDDNGALENDSKMLQFTIPEL